MAGPSAESSRGRRVDGLTVYGATGYTGRLVAAEAVRRGLAVCLAGRRRDALEALAGDLRRRPTTPGTPAPRVRIAVADAGDPSALLRLARDTRVLVSLVGPYGRWGRPVVEAALIAGCDYVDVTGELAFLTWVYAQHDRAVRAGVRLCPAVGFDGAPGELLAVLAARQARVTPAAPDVADVAEVRVAYEVRGGRLSGGSARSALDVLAAGGAARVGGQLVDEAAGVRTWTVPFPDEPRPALSIPFPEVVAVGASTGATQVRVYGVVPGPAAAVTRLSPLLARPARLAAGLLSWTPLEELAGRALDALPAGPSPERRGRARARVLAEVRGANVARRSIASFADLYQTTARSAVAVAQRLRDDPPRPGVRAPSQVCDPAELLRRMGATWRHLEV